jgi:hypothetical protein
MSTPPAKKGGPFPIMAAQKMYKVPEMPLEMVGMSTDSPSTPPMSKLVEMSPAKMVTVFWGVRLEK